jgi:hypothetical protein
MLFALFSATLASHYLRSDITPGTVDEVGEDTLAKAPQNTASSALSKMPDSLDSHAMTPGAITYHAANGSYSVLNSSALEELIRANCNIQLSGATKGQSSRMGIYTKLTQTNDGRPVYQFGTEYLYYHSGNGKWYVGKTVGGTSVGILLTDSASTPDRVTSTWSVYADSTFQTDTGLKATCTGGIYSSVSVLPDTKT